MVQIHGFVQGYYYWTRMKLERVNFTVNETRKGEF